MAVYPNRNATTMRQTRAAVDAGLRSHMLKVYNLMALGVACTGIVTLFMAVNPALMQTVALGPAKWILFIALLGLGFLAPKMIFTGSKALAHGAYWTYAVLWGLLISPMIYLFLNIPGGAADIARAFFITSAMFAGASLHGYVTKRDLSAFGRFFMMAAIGLLVAMLVNVFFTQSSGFSLIISFAVVLLFAGMTAYETQMIKRNYLEMRGRGMDNRLAIFGAFVLYGSFITMFIHVLNIIGIMRGSE
ncbi:MAG: Bax inhibitor-1/YccA family protein [Pseudomonadota bacterium]